MRNDLNFHHVQTTVMRVVRGLFKVLEGFLMPPKGLLGVLMGLIEPLEGPMRFYLPSSEGPAMSLTA